MADTHRIAVRVRGSIRGTAVDLDGAVRLIDDMVSIVVQDLGKVGRLDATRFGESAKGTRTAAAALLQRHCV